MPLLAPPPTHRRPAELARPTGKHGTQAFAKAVDTARRSLVYECTGDARNGQTLDTSTASDSWDITGHRTFSAWLKGDAGSYLTIYVETDDTTEPIRGLGY